MTEQTIKQLHANAKTIFADAIARWGQFSPVELFGDIEAMECSNGIMIWARHNGSLYRLQVAQREPQRPNERPSKDVEVKLEKLIDYNYQVIGKAVADAETLAKWCA